MPKFVTIGYGGEAEFERLGKSPAKIQSAKRPPTCSRQAPSGRDQIA